MARMRIVQRGPLFIPLYVQSANERDGDAVDTHDVTDKSGAITENADVLEKDIGSMGDFSCPVYSIEPEHESKHDPDITVETVEAQKEASDALKATDEVHSTNQGRPESTPLKRSLRRVATPPPDSDVPQATKRAKRASNWTAEETEALITCKLQPSLPKGNAGWEVISSQISGRSTQQCRQRWDTLHKPYKKMKVYCATHGKEVSQVSKEEFLSLKLDMTLFTNGHWYKMIDDYSCRPTIISSGPTANELTVASTSTHPVGNPNLPSSVRLNLEVARSELIPGAFPLEQGPPVVEHAARFLLPDLAAAEDRLPNTTAERSPPAMAADHLHDCDDPMSYWRRFFQSPEDTT